MAVKPSHRDCVLCPVPVDGPWLVWTLLVWGVRAAPQCWLQHRSARLSAWTRSQKWERAGEVEKPPGGCGPCCRPHAGGWTQPRVSLSDAGHSQCQALRVVGASVLTASACVHDLPCASCHFLLNLSHCFVLTSVQQTHPSRCSSNALRGTALQRRGPRLAGPYRPDGGHVPDKTPAANDP